MNEKENNLNIIINEFLLLLQLNNNSFKNIIEILLEYEINHDGSKKEIENTHNESNNNNNNNNTSENITNENENNTTITIKNDNDNDNNIKTQILQILGKLSQDLQVYKVENVLKEHLESFDNIINDESTTRECFRGNDFTKVMNFEELTKFYKSDYIQNIENEDTIPNISVSSNLNPDIINLLDAFDEAISKNFKTSEPEEIQQTNSRKKGSKTRRTIKGTGRGGRGSNKKGDSQGIDGDDFEIESKGNDIDETGVDQIDNTNDNSNLHKNDDNSLNGQSTHTSTSSMSTRKQVSKSAKWMTREGGSAGRSNVQAPEILRCLFIELANNGLIVKSIESKLALIQIQNIIESNTQHHTIQNDINSDNIQKINNDITNINNDLNFAETKISKKYSELAKVIEEITLKPTGRIASSVVTDCITVWHDSLDHFDNAWKEIFTENLDRQLRINQCLTSLRLENYNLSTPSSTPSSITTTTNENNQKSSFGIDEITPPADLVVNPFASVSKDYNQWEYLTQISESDVSTITSLRFACVNKDIPVHDPLSNSTIQLIRESKSHPFIHPKSLFYGKANVEECLGEIQFKTLISPFEQLQSNFNEKKDLLDDGSNILNLNSDSNDQNGIRTRKKRSNQDINTLTSEVTSTANGTQKINLTEEDALTNEITRSEKKFKFHIEEYLSLGNSNNFGTVVKKSIQPVSKGACFQFCIERATALLNLGHNIIIVDKTLEQSQHSHNSNNHNSNHNHNNGNGNNNGEELTKTKLTPNVKHRAQLISLIIRTNLGTIDSIPSIKSKKKKNTPISRWGPILIVTKIKDLLTWEEILQNECTIPIQVSSNSTRPIRLLSYYGNTTDRALLRSYMNTIHLYTEKSYCHIILTHYEAFFSDIYYFKPILWQMAIFDESWSIISNTKNKHLLDEINTLHMRHKIISCSGLSKPNTQLNNNNNSNNNNVFHPDIYLTIQFLFPALWNILDLQNELFFLNQSSNSSIYSNINVNNTELITKRLLQQLCASLTAICDEEISNLVHSNSLDTDEDTIRYYEIVESLPWYEWEGVDIKVKKLSKKRSNSNLNNVSYNQTINNNNNNNINGNNNNIANGNNNGLNSNYQIIYDFSKKVENTTNYTDVDIINEFNSLKFDTIGKLNDVNQKKSKQKGTFKNGDIIDNSISNNTNIGKKKVSKKVQIDYLSTSASIPSSSSSTTTITATTTTESIESTEFQKNLTSIQSLSSGEMKESQEDNDDENVVEAEAELTTIDQVNIIKTDDSTENDSKSNITKNEIDIIHTSENNNTVTNINVNSNDKDSEIDNENDHNEGEGGGNDEEIPSNLSEINSSNTEVTSNPSNIIVTNTPTVTTITTTTNTTTIPTNNNSNSNSNSNNNNENDNNEMVFGKQAPPKIIKRKISAVPSTGSTPSTKPKPATIRHLEPDEELLKSVAMRGDRWQASLIFPGRVRFLGLYRSEEAVMRAYTVALHQRRVLLTEGLTYLPRIKFTGDILGGFEGCVTLPSLGRKRKSHEFLSESEIIEKSTNDSLEKSIADMMQTTVLSGVETGSWECPDYPPPAYAMLQGPKGFIAYLTNKTNTLGKLYSSTIELAKNLGVGDPIGLGSFYGEGHVDIHLGDDSSIARQHAIIRFNDVKSCFEIEALHPIYVQGEKLLPGYPPIPLTSRGIIQIGCKIFYFILPIRNNSLGKAKQLYRSAEPEKLDIPSASIRSITNVLLETIKLRRKGCYPDGTLVSDFIPTPEETNEINTLLDELTKLQDNLFPTPRSGKAILPLPATNSKKRVRDEEMFIRSAITDNEKGAPRPTLPNQIGRVNQNANSALLSRVNQQGGVSPSLNQESDYDVNNSQQQSQSQSQSQPQPQYIGLDEMNITNKTDLYKVHTDDGIKYARMPPALRPEKSKKVEKPKASKALTPQQLAFIQQQQQYQQLQHHGVVSSVTTARPLLVNSTSSSHVNTNSVSIPSTSPTIPTATSVSVGLSVNINPPSISDPTQSNSYPRAQVPYKYYPPGTVPLGPRGPLGPAPRVLPRPPYQPGLRPPYPTSNIPGGVIPRATLSSGISGSNLSVGARPLMSNNLGQNVRAIFNSPHVQYQQNPPQVQQSQSQPQSQPQSNPNPSQPPL